MPDTDDIIKVELSNLHDHNQALIRELNDLKKERIAWEERDKVSSRLEGTITRLNQDIAASQAENARLRKQNEDLQRKLEREMVEFGCEGQVEGYGADSDCGAKTDRVKLKELRDLYNSFEDRDRCPLQTLTTQVTNRDLQFRKQEKDILELQRTVEALMDEIELGQENAQFLFSVMEDPSEHVDGGCLFPVDSDDEGPQGSHHALMNAKSLGSLADEYRRLNEPVPESGGSQSSLRARCAALGLSTEGNRAILKKRLMRHIAKKKKQAEKTVVGA
ncbi:hypothetical protein BC829DRAFT_405679 [Chytridium lagenaria]|nr:hypothetical protein BC829DRAFT_405679 [Chytridium lagenaria]